MARFRRVLRANDFPWSGVGHESEQDGIGGSFESSKNKPHDASPRLGMRSRLPGGVMHNTSTMPFPMLSYHEKSMP